MKKSITLATAGALSLAALSPLNATPEESRALFQEVTSELHLGGKSLIYLEMDGVVDNVADWATAFYQKLSASDPMSYPPFPIDFKSQFRTLGLGQIQAYGASYAEGEDGVYEVRGFLRTEGAPAGIFELYKNQDTGFSVAEMSPSDADLVFDGSIEWVALERVIRKVANSIMGPMADGFIDGALMNTLDANGITGKDLIEVLSTRFTGYIDFGNLELFDAPGADLSQLNPKAYLKVAGAGEMLGAIANLMGATLSPSDAAGVSQYLVLEVPYVSAFLFATDSGDLVLSHEVAIQESVASPLSEDADYQTLTQGLPDSGALFAYYSENLEKAQAIPVKMLGLDPSNPILAEMVHLSETLSGKGAAWSEVRENGLYTVTRTTNSLGEQFALALATSFVPAFLQGQLGGGGSDVEIATIEDNLRSVAAAGLQYMREQGEDTVTYRKLVEEGYFAELEPVAGETYEDITVDSGGGVIVIITADGEVVTFEY